MKSFTKRTLKNTLKTQFDSTYCSSYNIINIFYSTSSFGLFESFKQFLSDKAAKGLLLKSDKLELDKKTPEKSSPPSKTVENLEKTVVGDANRSKYLITTKQTTLFTTLSSLSRKRH